MRLLPAIIVAVAVILAPVLWVGLTWFLSEEDFQGSAVDSGARIEIEVLRQQVEDLQGRMETLENEVARLPAGNSGGGFSSDADAEDARRVLQEVEEGVDRARHGRHGGDEGPGQRLQPFEEVDRFDQVLDELQRGVQPLDRRVDDGLDRRLNRGDGLGHGVDDPGVIRGFGIEAQGEGGEAGGERKVTCTCLGCRV